MEILGEPRELVPARNAAASAPELGHLRVPSCVRSAGDGFPHAGVGHGIPSCWLAPRRWMRSPSTPGVSAVGTCERGRAGKIRGGPGTERP